MPLLGLQFFECWKQFLPSSLPGDTVELEKSNIRDMGQLLPEVWLHRQTLQPEKDTAKRVYDRDLQTVDGVKP